MFRQVLYAGAFNTIPGGEIGDFVLRHPGIQGISLTGPVDTGRKIAAGGGEGMKRITLELGGNDPAIVLDDIDPSQFAERIFEEAFWLCGQVCLACTRVLPRSTSL